MNAPTPGQPGRPKDYLVVDGMFVHKRWLNEDGTRKAGAELEAERIRVELEIMAQRLLAVRSD